MQTSSCMVCTRMESFLNSPKFSAFAYKRIGPRYPSICQLSVTSFSVSISNDGMFGNSQRCHTETMHSD